MLHQLAVRRDRAHRRTLVRQAAKQRCLLRQQQAQQAPVEHLTMIGTRCRYGVVVGHVLLLDAALRVQRLLQIAREHIHGGSGPHDFSTTLRSGLRCV